MSKSVPPPPHYTVAGEQTTLAEHKQRAMSRLILGFDGLMPSAELRELCRIAPPAGFISFRRNVESPLQVLECNLALKQLSPSSSPPIISVDQEGGRVRRIKQTDWPPMRWVGNMDDLKTTQRVAQGLALELLALGFNTDWAPCADVDSNPDNPVIGDRSFGRDPQLCARHVQTFIESMNATGMISCAKHFPGHGDTSVDSHLDLPFVEKTLSQLEQCELIPFQSAIAAGVEVMMTAHVVFPELDPENPATMSSRILSGILREQYGYQGLIVSDDMEMKAVRGRYPLTHQLDLSCRAGVDVFLVCSDPVLQQASVETLIHLQERQPEHIRLAELSSQRLQSLRQRYLLNQPQRSSLSMLGASEWSELSAWIKSEGGETV